MVEFNPDSHKGAPPGWPEDLSWPADKQSLIAAVHRRGQTLAALSTEAGFSRRLLNVALHSRCSPSGERLVAEFLGVSRELLFDRDFWSRSRKGAAPASETPHMKEPAA